MRRACRVQVAAPALNSQASLSGERSRGFASQAAARLRAAGLGEPWARFMPGRPQRRASSRSASQVVHTWSRRAHRCAHTSGEAPTKVTSCQSPRSRRRRTPAGASRRQDPAWPGRGDASSYQMCCILMVHICCFPPCHDNFSFAANQHQRPAPLALTAWRASASP